MLLLLVVCAVLFALSLAVGLFPNVADGGFKQFVGWLGAVFFGLGFLIWIGRALKMGQATLSLSPQGFRDVRLSPDWVPWSAVENLSTWSLLGTTIIVAKISDASWNTLRLTRSARWSRSQNKSLGVDGLAIAAVDLAVRVDDLLTLMTTYQTSHLAAQLERFQNQKFDQPIASFSQDLADGIDYDLKKANAHIRPFPDPGDVFVSEQIGLAEYMHPLVSIDLAIVNPEWSGFVHIVSPIEPAEGLIGDGTERFHNEYLNENCIVFKVENGKYSFMGDKRYFLKAWDRSQVPSDQIARYNELSEHYDVEERSYRHGLSLYRKTGNVHRLDADGNFVFGNREPEPLLEKLGGYAEIYNFHVGIDIEAEYGRNPTGHGDYVVPYSKAGRPYRHVASVPGYFYRNRGADSIVLFYEPVEKLALTTFDWT